MPELAAALSVSALVLRAKQLEIDAVRQLASRAELVDAIGQLIQGLQRERGASSIYLASQAQRFAEMRRKIVGEVQPLETQLEFEARAISQCARTEDSWNAIQAVLAKRKPEFAGR